MMHSHHIDTAKQAQPLDLRADAAAGAPACGQAVGFLDGARDFGRCVCGSEDSRVAAPATGCPGSLPSEFNAGWSSPVARQAHNLQVGGSNPSPATNRGKRPCVTRDGEAYREGTCSPLPAAPLAGGGCRVALGLEGRARGFTESRSADFSRAAQETQEGDRCPFNGCDGTMVLHRDERGCFCHIVAPCSTCTDAYIACDVCGQEVFPC